MPASRRWSFPLFPPSELDRQVLALCAPRGSPPACTDASAVLARAEALDLFPLACHRLRQAGASIAPEWSERFRANAARNLYFHSEQARLRAELASAGVCSAPLKGTSLAERAYGDPALRSQVDLDFYVAPRDLPSALDSLSRAGYRQATSSAVTAARLARTGDEFTSECQLVSTGNGMPVLVELHWRILPLSDEELRRALGSQAAPGLPPDLNFLYLCLRAATDGWGSLKLLCDLAHWLEREPPDWERVLRLAGRLGLRRIVGLTLDALRVYFGVQTPAAVAESLASAWPRALPAFAVANPFAPATNLSPGAHHRFRLVLRERFSDRVGYAARLLRPTASDLAALPLPRGLGFLYWGVRWLRLSGLLKDGWKRRPRSLETAHS
jgi:hypothetical protein